MPWAAASAFLGAWNRAAARSSHRRPLPGGVGRRPPGRHRAAPRLRPALRPHLPPRLQQRAALARRPPGRLRRAAVAPGSRLAHNADHPAEAAPLPVAREGRLLQPGQCACVAPTLPCCTRSQCRYIAWAWCQGELPPAPPLHVPGDGMYGRRFSRARRLWRRRLGHPL
jgi:hypothetical protein